MLIIIFIVIVIIISTRKTDQNTVKVVALHPLTGGLASWGESSQKATQIAVNEINALGGIDGKKFEVVYEDHKCDPKTATSIYQQAVSKTKIFTSSSCSGTVLSIAPNLEKDNAVILATVVASVKISSSSPRVYRNWAVETRQADIVAGEIKKKGYTKVGILHEQTDFGKGLALSLDNSLKGQVSVITESFSTGATDFRTQLTKLSKSGIQAVFLAPQSEASSQVILAQMEELKMSPAIYVNDIILGAPKLITDHAALLEGARGGRFVVDSPKLQNFLKTYKDTYGTDCPQVSACAVAYDSIYMLKDAISVGNSPEQIGAYLKNIQYDGVSGNVSFDQSNDRSGVGYVLSEITGGKSQVVK